MITQCCYLDKYDWLIKVFYEVKSEDIEIILNELDDMDCDPISFYKLADLFEDDPVNSGFTYTDTSKHVTFIILSKTTCAAEFQSSLDHEKGHCAVHIAEYFNLDLLGEDYQYLQGEIGRQTFLVAKRFLCDNCRISFNNYRQIKMKI